MLRTELLNGAIVHTRSHQWNINNFESKWEVPIRTRKIIEDKTDLVLSLIP